MITQKIVAFLKENNVDFLQIEHEPTPTSADSAKARNENIGIGAKALILKVDTQFVMVVLPADKKLNSKALKKYYSTKNLRFATVEELFELTGLVPGAIPPFGQFFNIPLLVEESLFANEEMAFNAGSLTQSIKMKTSEYKRVVQPKTAFFGKY